MGEGPLCKVEGGKTNPSFLALNLRKKLFYFSMEAYIVHLAKGIRIFGTIVTFFYCFFNRKKLWGFQ
jgi:hypothetical protein